MKLSPIRRANRLASIACVLLAALGTSALAAEPKPDILLKDKFVEVNVSFDAAIKADASLVKNLTTSGKAWAAKTFRDVSALPKDGGDMPTRPEPPWAVERSYTQRTLVAGRYVSIIRSEYRFTGGAHPDRSSDTLLWDRRAKKMVSIRPFFTDLADNGEAMTAIRDAIVVDLKTEMKRRIPDDPNMSLIDALEPKLLKIGPASLMPSTIPGKSSGLTFYYSPYAVGSYAEGDYDAFVPWEKLKPYLSAEGSAIFAGERPKDDDKGPQ
ncbi:DUF3298 and DUF4163 domain-containing protein [Tardiphaga sp. P9-11]|jgi:hypothetical protein|uniref:DUF3298 and DUF4163 domain-containing protein n=1 Tax=Tardiphaga sp. P9-11 TaxID=2024614 RepID=UPI0011F192B1|nr:DUF3298 and DUF4163 domain-containing protein [Tardiphaga sp. P9-11]KAA0076395.1 DUF3298 domain-containing protein [Tardiphaga sp. P9-11]